MSPKYPKKLETLGDHIRKKRLDLRLLQQDLAEQIGVSEATIYNWERNATRPPNRSIPAVIRFLGYNPLPCPQNLAESLLAARKARGLTQRQAAKLVGLNESTLAKLEQGRCRRPAKTTLDKLAALIGLGSSRVPSSSKLG
jgi:transcriptional regulator with XRE-family HTH domain